MSVLMEPEFIDIKTVSDSYFPRVLTARGDDRFKVQLQDKQVEMSGAYLLANLLFWYPYLKRNIQISSRYLFREDELLVDSVVSRIRTAMYDDFRASGASLVELYDMQDDLLRVVNNFYNVYVLELGKFHRSVSIFELARAFKNKAIAKACDISDIQEFIDKGTKAVEQYLDRKYDEAMAAFSSDEAKDTVIYPYIKLGIVNRTQVSQVAVAAGMRTDVDDKMVSMPVIHSYANMIRGIVPFFIDSLMAKKSEVYNDIAMSDAQYNNRKVQLMSSEIRFIYPGDCGTRVYTDVHIHQAYTASYIGMNICVDEDSRTLVELNYQNISKYFDKTVKMLTPLTCRHTDGYCHACGGKMSHYIPPTTVPGLASAVELMSTVSQMVLSNKHVQKTDASVYAIPRELTDYFVNIHNDMYFRDSVEVKSLAIGVQLSAMDKIGDLVHVKGDLNEQYFSTITHITIGRADTLEAITHRIPLCNNEKSAPYLAQAALNMIMKHPDCMTVIGNTVWYKLEHFDRTQPFMRSVIANDSTRDFVKSVETMIMFQIKNKTSCAEALRDISSMVWRKTRPHILHLATVIRATMITSDADFSIPVVEDPDNVRFAQLGRLIPRRSIGTQMAFERFHLYIFDAGTYVFPKHSSVFDPYLAPNDPEYPIPIRPELVEASIRANTGRKNKGLNLLGA